MRTSVHPRQQARLKYLASCEKLGVLPLSISVKNSKTMPLAPWTEKHGSVFVLRTEDRVILGVWEIRNGKLGKLLQKGEHGPVITPTAAITWVIADGSSVKNFKPGVRNKAESWLVLNPDVASLFLKYAEEAHQTNAKVSSRTIFDRVKWDLALLGRETPQSAVQAQIQVLLSQEIIKKFNHLAPYVTVGQGSYVRKVLSNPLLPIPSLTVQKRSYMV